jgi:nucleotide-binding universal stress UspA family protein
MNGLFDTILVPHDLSRHASRALKIAARLVGRRGKLIVLHVVNEYANSPFQKKVLEIGRRQLERLVPATLPGGPSLERRVEAGNPYLRIIAAARDADSIVMCTAGRTGLSHFAIGSVAEKVVRHAPVPVLSFHPTRARRVHRSRAKGA